jgi:hypothetical protein
VNSGKWTAVAAWVKRFPWIPVAAVLLGVGTAVYMIVTSGSRQLSQREMTLFQIIELGLGLYGAFFVGQRAARDAGGDLVRMHARPAFRRLLSLYEALGRLQASIGERRAFINRVANQADATVDIVHVEAQLDVLDVQVIGDLATANDAMEDWRDLVPDEVQKLEAIARSRVRRAEGTIRVIATDQLAESAVAQLPTVVVQAPDQEVG